MIIRHYFKCKAKVMEDTGMLEPIVKLPRGCNLEVLTYFTEKEKISYLIEEREEIREVDVTYALLRVRATDKPDLMTAITDGLQIKAGRELLKEFVDLNPDLERIPAKQAEELFFQKTGVRREFSKEIEEIGKTGLDPEETIEILDTSEGGDE